VRFDGKTAIVTGSARGIGQAVALGFAREGAGVVVADVREKQGRDTVGEIQRLGSTGIFVRTDVSVASQVNELVEKTLKAFGRIDILVNVAGICPFMDFLEMDEEVWDRVQAVNLKGVFLCSQAAGKAMVEGGVKGRIISVGSISSLVGGAQQAHYTASKAGINMLTASMAIAVGPHGITCNAVLPGPIETDINREDLADQDKRAYFINRTPLGRIGQPEDVVGPVLFFASEDSAWCTGSTLVVDGGILVNFQ
jgi:L-rhamnose 1-dehydrogenase